MIDITGLDHAEVLLALWKHSHEQGMSFFGRFTNNPTIEDCRKHLRATGGYVDYFNSRVIKCHLEPDVTEIHPGLYDRDCGSGTCERAIDSIR